MNREWRDPTPLDVPSDLAAFVGGHQLLAHRLTRLGITSVEAAEKFLDPLAYMPASPYELPDMDRAAARVQSAVQTGEPILIWGDFDVDGQTSTALLYLALRELGANVRYHVPVRATEGHGIDLKTLTRELDAGVGLLLTCDTGIAAHDAVELAASRGVETVITDHHTLAETLPPAHAVVNPMRLPEGHPLRELPGVGVAFQLIRALAGEVAAQDHLDLVALGIVGDVMVQVDDTRYWLQRGLRALRVTRRLGLEALMERAEIDPLDVNETDIGFGLAPRLNAQGRLGDAALSVELLTTDDRARAFEIANYLEGVNEQRKMLMRSVYDGAKLVIEREPALLEYAALVIAHPEWHAGVVGIVASRLVEEYQRPVLLLKQTDDKLGGSARSVPGCNITAAIKTQAPLLLRCGGHAMAAGVSLRADDLFHFRRGVSRAVREQLEGKPPVRLLEVDAYLGLGEISLDFAYELARLAPFGNGNPPLTLATRDVVITRSGTLGRLGEHRELLLEDAAGDRCRALWWNSGTQLVPDNQRIDVAYTLRVGHFRGEAQAQLEVIDIRAADGKPITVVSEPTIEVIDHRRHPNPRAALAAILAAEPDALVWHEGADRDMGGVDRYDLRPASTLIVWTCPPGEREYQAALALVNPKRVIVFGVPALPEDVEGYVKRLWGLARFVISAKDGETTLSALTSATAGREALTRAGLRWLAAGGQVVIASEDDDALHLAPGFGKPQDPAMQKQLMKLIQREWDEMRAYQRYWQRAPAGALGELRS